MVRCGLRALHDSHLHPANLAFWIILARRHRRCGLSGTRVAATVVGEDPVLKQSVFAPNFGSNKETMLFAVAMILTLLALAGGTIVKGILRLISREKRTSTQILAERTTPRSSDCIDPTGPSCRSSSTDPRIILTHGWGLDTHEWNTSEEIFWTVFEAEVQMGGAAQHLPMDSQVQHEPSADMVTTAASQAQCTHARGKAVLFHG